MKDGQPLRIGDSVAVVTGANRGIGPAFVRELLDRGVRRVYAAGRDTTALGHVVALDRARVIALQLDLLDPKQIARAAAETGPISLLINNAGVAAFGSVLVDDSGGASRACEKEHQGARGISRAGGHRHGQRHRHAQDCAAGCGTCCPRRGGIRTGRYRARLHVPRRAWRLAEGPKRRGAAVRRDVARRGGDWWECPSWN